MVLSVLMTNSLDAILIGVNDSTSANMELSGVINISKQGKYAYISYSGQENVMFAIDVNGYDVLSEEYPYAEWNNSASSYELNLYDMSNICDYDQYDMYSYYYHVTVTVSADGYNSLSHQETVVYTLTPDFPPPSIDSWLTPVSLVIYVYGWSTGAHDLFINGVWVDSYEQDTFEIPRLDEDYTVSISAYYKTLLMTEWISYYETLLVPAKLYGDLDGDEMLSVSDVTILIDYLLGYNYYLYYDNGDVNKDGIITISDVTMLIDKILQQSI